MADRWNTFALDKFFPEEVRSLAEGADTLVSSVTKLFKLVEAALKVTSALASQAASNPVEAALSEILEELESTLEGLLEGTTAHAIMIPLQKQPYGRGEAIPAEDVDEAEITPDFDQFLTDNAFYRQTVDDITPDAVSFINTSHTALGGNKGFWRALTLSTRDEGDAARPKFPGDYAVTGVAVVYGADTMAELQTNFDTFSQLLHVGDRSDPAARTRPVVQNLKALAVPVIEEGHIGVLLSWDPLPPVTNFKFFSDEQIISTEIFIIRSTNPQVRGFFSWGDLFSSQPSGSSSDLPEEGDHKVIARVPNDGFVKQYIDSESLVEGTTYYYTASVRYKVEDEFQPMGPLSAVQRTKHSGRAQSTRKSELPDWWATPSLVQLFPPLEGILGQIHLTLSSFKTRSASSSGIQSVIDQTISQVQGLIKQGEEIVEEFSHATDKLIALSSTELAATSATSFSITQGGIDGWLAELGQRLGDTSDPTRPPFDGGELVGGFVIVAGAPSLPSLEPFAAILELFFGSGEDNPLLDALDSVDAVISTPTETVFDDDMNATRVDPNDVPEETTPAIVFDETMKPADSVDCT